MGLLGCLILLDVLTSPSLAPIPLYLTVGKGAVLSVHIVVGPYVASSDPPAHPTLPPPPPARLAPLPPCRLACPPPVRLICPPPPAHLAVGLLPPVVSLRCWALHCVVGPYAASLGLTLCRWALRFVVGLYTLLLGLTLHCWALCFVVGP